jgi:DNA-directed RNA polymerase specialized sigma24 family protein
MSLLDDVSKKDKYWRELALVICKDKNLADDIVQDMYIKLSKINKSEVNDGYVFFTIKTLFLDHCRKQTKNYKFVNDLSSALIIDKSKEFEPDDYEYELLLRYYGLDWKQQELIQLNYDLSLREIEELHPMINYGYAHRLIITGLKEILGDNFDKLYNNTRLKYTKNGKKE